MIRLCILLFCLFSFFAGLMTCGRAQPPLVVILLPGTSIEDWQAAEAPTLHQLMKTGALAVMNTRTARLPSDHARETPESASLTLGAGARAAGSHDTLVFVSALSGSTLYTRRMGQPPLPGQFVNPQWPGLLHANERLGYQIRLGNLADTLAARKLVLLTGGGPFAEAVAATHFGTIYRVSHVTVSNEQCLIWDAGSNAALADALIAKAAAQISRQHGRLLILSPFADDSDYSHGRRLTPVLEWGESVPSGLLFSPSTHRLGLVTNTDFAPTVAAYFGLKREDFPTRPFGDVWTAVSAVGPEQKLLTLQSQAETQALGMKLLPYLAIALGGWVLIGTMLLFAKRLPSIWPVIPLVLLASALFCHSLIALAVLCAAVLFALWAFGSRLGTSHVSLVLLGLIATTLILDMLTGSRLMQRNLLGYSAIEGARYYGIGNEAMGALIGALLILAGRLWKPLRNVRWALLLGLAVISLLLGSANAGAKAGGLVVSLTAFGTLGFTLLGGRWSVRGVLTLILSITLIMAGAAVADAFWLPGAHSHLGEAVRRIQSGGLSEAGDIAARKLAVETRLAYHSAWACPLWGGLICLGLLWRWETSAAVEDRAMKQAGIIALAACVLLNDAGVVAGALCLIPLWCDRIAVQQTKWPLQKRKSAARAT